ncbi:hypothetical protein [Hydrogenovibrio halophilus]|uniref:hypothetical protein n=1 Tax=Hydrogenovibrio halophilus TaxID=373391 RepID=UPI0012FE56C4|nr:hypothetical protein [Hydrogenovibrio halophilus]
MALSATACTTTGDFQPKPGQAQADFKQDRVHCQRLSMEKWENHNRLQADDSMHRKAVPASYRRCMETLGY